MGTPIEQELATARNKAKRLQNALDAECKANFALAAKLARAEASLDVADRAMSGDSQVSIGQALDSVRAAIEDIGRDGRMKFARKMERTMAAKIARYITNRASTDAERIVAKHIRSKFTNES